MTLTYIAIPKGYEIVFLISIKPNLAEDYVDYSILNRFHPVCKKCGSRNVATDFNHSTAVMKQRCDACGTVEIVSELSEAPT